MDVIRRTDLERLVLQGAGPSVSVFLPTHRSGPEVRQAPIRLKNLLREATEALQTDGVKAPMIDSPLLPLLTGDGHFFVLALSQHRIRLLEGTRDRLEEVNLPGVPLGVRDALQGEEARKQLQLYVADRGGVAARGIFHGHGSAGDVQEERVLRYFRKVNRALREVLAGEPAPMVLAAVEHLTPIWRQVNQLAGTGLTSPEPPGDHPGRRGRARRHPVRRPHPAGSPSSAGRAPSLNGDRALRDVLEQTAVATLIKGGAVYVLPAGEVPGGGSVAAVFRY